MFPVYDTFVYIRYTIGYKDFNNLAHRPPVVAKFNSKFFCFFVRGWLQNLQKVHLLYDQKNLIFQKCNMGIIKRRVWCSFRIHWQSCKKTPAKNVFCIKFSVLWYPNGILDKKSFFAYLSTFCIFLKPNADETAQKTKNVVYKCVCNTNKYVQKV